MSEPRNPNRRMADAVAVELVRSGVREVCLSPGSRSAPLALALTRSAAVRTFVVGDERAAGFFALGMARELRRPVVLLSTSGTAAANYLPAVVEASLAHVPLVVLTADRPPELRDCGAPQTIDQVRLFGSHVLWSVDLPAPSDDPDLEAHYRTVACRAAGTAVAWPGGPVQVNVPMREPLFDVEEEAAARASLEEGMPPFASLHAGAPALEGPSADDLAAKLGRASRGVVVCGPGTDPGAAAAIARLADALGWPILADPLSGLRFGHHDRSSVADAYDLLLRDADFAASHAPEAVLQIGRLPASKPLSRLLAAAQRGTHVVVAPDWPDPLHRATDVVRSNTGPTCAALAGRIDRGGSASAWRDDWIAASKGTRTALDRALAAEDEVLEGKLFPLLVERLRDETLVVLGSSMPVRDADTFLSGGPRAVAFAGNRGASGIDGVASSALGAAAARRGPTVLVVGDLSFLHDLGALQIAARHGISLLVVVVQNDGGGIFSFLPTAQLASFERLFATPHGLELAPAVRMCGGRHVRVESWPAFVAAIDREVAEPGLRVVELASDRERNRELHERAVAAALEPLRRARGRAA